MSEKDINSETAKSSKVDGEFDFAENENICDSERLALLRDLSDEVYDPSSLIRLREKEIEEINLGWLDGVSAYLLPDIPGKDGGDLETIREIQTKDGPQYVMKTAERLFVKVNQGHMWKVPIEENPYFRVGLSTCSVLVGKSNNTIIVAHVSYSDKEETEQAIDFMEENGVDKDNIFVVASVSDAEEKSGDLGRPWLKKKESYENYGIKPEQILTFEHHFESDEKNGGKDSNLTEVLITPSLLMKWSYDARISMVNGFMKNVRISDFRDEESLKMSA